MKKLLTLSVATSCALSAVAQEEPIGMQDQLKSAKIIALAPLQITDNGFGIGLSYESFNKTGEVSLILPVYATINPRADDTGYPSYNPISGPRMDPMVHFQPGIKFHSDLSSNTSLKIAYGANLIFGAGVGRTDVKNTALGIPDITIKRTRVVVGAAGSIYGSTIVNKSYFLGWDASLGFSYVNTYDGVNVGIAALAQTGVRIGYVYKSQKMKKRTSK